MFRLLLFVLSVTAVLSCKESSDGVAKYGVDTSLDVSTQLSALNEKITLATNDEKQEMLRAGYNLAQEAGKADLSIPYAVSLIKNGAKDREDLLLTVGTAMNTSENKAAAQLLLQGLVDKYPSSSAGKSAKELLTQPIIDKEAYITKVAESVFENPDKFGINTTNAQRYVDVCEAYALAYPDQAKTPEYLYKASEIAVAIRTFPKALNIYDWLIADYPDYSKTPNALFAKGYLLDEELNKRDMAKTTFAAFIQRYPEHELADDAKFLLENIGKSGEEIIKIIEANKKEKEAASK